MIDLALENDEGIIFERLSAHVNGKISNVYLTHKNIITTHEIGFFKIKQVVTKYPLEELKIINDEVQITITNPPYEYLLRLMFLDKTVEISFSYSKNKKNTYEEINKWANKIYTLLSKKIFLLEENLPTDEKCHAQTSINKTIDQKISRFCINCGTKIEGSAGSTIYCTNCGKKYTL